MLDGGSASRARAARAYSLVLLALGCARLQPAVRLPAQRGGVAIELKELRLSPFNELLFTVRSADARRLSQAWFTVATGSPCSGGDELNDIVPLGITISSGASGRPAFSGGLLARFFFPL